MRSHIFLLGRHQKPVLPSDDQTALSQLPHEMLGERGAGKRLWCTHYTPDCTSVTLICINMHAYASLLLNTGLEHEFRANLCIFEGVIKRQSLSLSTNCPSLIRPTCVVSARCAVFCFSTWIELGRKVCCFLTKSPDVWSIRHKFMTSGNDSLVKYIFARSLCSSSTPLSRPTPDLIYLKTLSQ